MAIYDRDYVFKDRARPRGFSALSVNTWLIAINAIIFVLGALTPQFGRVMLTQGHLSTYEVTYAGGLEFWRFLTFQFLHSGLSHVFFNMLGLYIFGSMVEQYLGAKRYLAFYLTTGVAGGLLFMLLNAGGVLAEHYGWPKIPALLVYSTKTPLIGASAGVFGVIMACAYISPNSIIHLLFPPVPLKLRTFAYIYVGIAGANLLFGGSNAGGDAAHLGGALAGAFLIRNAHLLRDFFDVFKDSRQRSRTIPMPRQHAPARGGAVDPAEVDRILAKVSREGLASLTDSEKATLRRSTESASPRP
jgi:membrane associated rhomboid family serine protease